MSKKATNSTDTYDLSKVPMYFADQPAALMLGPLNSRITFGVAEDDGGDFPRPVVTIAIPTIALIQLVHDLKKSLEHPKFRKESAQFLFEAVKTIASGGKPTPAEEMIVNDTPRRRVRRVIAPSK